MHRSYGLLSAAGQQSHSLESQVVLGGATASAHHGGVVPPGASTDKCNFIRTSNWVHRLPWCSKSSRAPVAASTATNPPFEIVSLRTLAGAPPEMQLIVPPEATPPQLSATQAMSTSTLGTSVQPTGALLSPVATPPPPMPSTGFPATQSVETTWQVLTSAAAPEEAVLSDVALELCSPSQSPSCDNQLVHRICNAFRECQSRLSSSRLHMTKIAKECEALERMIAKSESEPLKRPVCGPSGSLQGETRNVHSCSDRGPCDPRDPSPFPQPCKRLCRSDEPQKALDLLSIRPVCRRRRDGRDSKKASNEVATSTAVRNEPPVLSTCRRTHANKGDGEDNAHSLIEKSNSCGDFRIRSQCNFDEASVHPSYIAGVAARACPQPAVSMLNAASNVCGAATNNKGDGGCKPRCRSVGSKQRDCRGRNKIPLSLSKRRSASEGSGFLVSEADRKKRHVIHGVVGWRGGVRLRAELDESFVGLPSVGSSDVPAIEAADDVHFGGQGRCDFGACGTTRVTCTKIVRAKTNEHTSHCQRLPKRFTSPEGSRAVISARPSSQSMISDGGVVRTSDSGSPFEDCTHCTSPLQARALAPSDLNHQGGPCMESPVVSPSVDLEAPPAPASPWRGCRLRLVAELDADELRSASSTPTPPRHRIHSGASLVNPTVSATSMGCRDAGLKALPSVPAAEERPTSATVQSLTDSCACAKRVAPSPKSRGFVLPEAPSPTMLPSTAVSSLCGEKAEVLVPCQSSLHGDASGRFPGSLPLTPTARIREGDGMQSSGSRYPSGTASEATTIDVWGHTSTLVVSPTLSKGASTATEGDGAHSAGPRLRHRRRSHRRSTSCDDERVQLAANKAFQAKNYPRAVALFSEAIDAVPDNHLLYSDRAVCFVVLGRYADALKDGNRCVRLRPDWARGYGRRGLAEFFLGDFSAAADSYRQGLTLSPDDPALLEGFNQAVEAAKKQRLEEENAIGRILRNIFDRCDTNRNGHCGKAEIIKACRKNPDIAKFFSLPSQIHQEDGTKDQFEALFQIIDADDDRTISWAEFHRHFSNRVHKKALQTLYELA
eukprot:TRINITY_DN69969_c0_g1_i1.p1 TRINITY_DN69969_c0_g1~~TRINITY_DN69969_c0_g1_i1.p1  ORF type:complete len:1062 (-),score=124.37 TRINITY_DN69969_c0_g1_i1:126-3311(-)